MPNTSWHVGRRAAELLSTKRLIAVQTKVVQIQPGAKPGRQASSCWRGLFSSRHLWQGTSLHLPVMTTSETTWGGRRFGFCLPPDHLLGLLSPGGFPWGGHKLSSDWAVWRAFFGWPHHWHDPRSPPIIHGSPMVVKTEPRDGEIIFRGRDNC